MIATIAVFTTSAAAQSYTVSITASQPNLGNVASAASGDTRFHIEASTGGVSRMSGLGARISTGSARATVTVRCGNQSACNNADVNIRIGTLGSATRRLRNFSSFDVAMGSATLVGSVSGSSLVTFKIGPVGRNGSKTFYLGGDLDVQGDESGQLTGAAQAGFYVYASKNTPTSGSAGYAMASVYRSLSLTKHADLAFGRIIKPKTGSSVVTLDAVSGNGTVTGGGMFMSSPSQVLASYTVTGETGKTISIDIPATFPLNGPGGSLTVTTNDDAAGLPFLSTGSYDFRVGGSFPISANTPTGAYTGSFMVQVNYN